MHRYFALVVLGITLALPGCASKITHKFTDYQVVKMDMSELSPIRTGNPRQKKPTAAVFAYEETSSSQAKRVNAKDLLVRYIEVYLQRAGVELVSRQGSERERLEEETTLYKVLTGSGEYTGPKHVDYLVMGILTSVDTAGSYEAPHTVKGKTYPAQCAYNATATGAVRVYSVADANILQTIPLKGGASRRVDATSSRCGVTDNVLPLVRGALERAVYNSRTPLQSLFAQEGFILTVRVFSERFVRNGAKPSIQPRRKAQ